MRLSLRFLVPLMLALAAFAYVAVPMVDSLMQRWFVRDLDMRSSLISSAVAEQIGTLIQSGSTPGIIAFFNRMTRDERLYAVGLCLDAKTEPLATTTFPRTIRCDDLDRFASDTGRVLHSAQGLVHVAVRPVDPNSQAAWPQLVIVHDMSFVNRRSEETRRYLFYFFIALGLAIALITVIIAQLSWRGWVAGMRALLRGEGIVRPSGVTSVPELKPIASDVRDLIRDLERQYRPLDGSQRIWDQAALRSALRSELHGNDVIALSNREPYIHLKNPDGSIRIQRPASGLVTALEPVMRACSGTWVAHGSGSADREVVDRHDHIAVPPEHPYYKLRRVWLTKEEEEGYYSGFANEGLWPLCHIAHVRPIFRSRDWDYYRSVNGRFADAVVQEATLPDPIVLVQDYHYALVPRLIRNRLPDATILTFWHIPWPNPEAFSICPWRAELLDGMLGSSSLGFHTRFHVNNFLDTVDRVLEARVDRETLTVSYQGKATQVHVYPISIDWPPAALATARPIAETRRSVRERLGLPPSHKLGLGVDRLDYTKGIVERFNAVARLLEREPHWIGRFTFIQIAAPSRAMIADYRDYGARVHALAAEINSRYPGAEHPPIALVAEHHEPDAVYEYYRAIDVCFVSSLHDGMNLVAKEFVASRDDEQGVLVLSQFAGASRELAEALVVNPYDADQCAAALHHALTMKPEEQRDRMRFMRAVVREFNVYRWAGRMLLDAAVMRQRGRFRADVALARG